jgi:hypothetical protein
LPRLEIAVFWLVLSGTILRPGFIYGKRRLNRVDIPLEIVGPGAVGKGSGRRSIINPAIAEVTHIRPLACSSNDVAAAAVRALQDDEYFGIFTKEQIKEMAKV